MFILSARERGKLKPAHACFNKTAVFNFNKKNLLSELKYSPFRLSILKIT